MEMYCIVLIALQIGLPALFLSILHASMWGFSLSSAILIWFIIINMLITVWELALYYCFPVLRKEHERREKLGFYNDSEEGRKVRSSITMNLFRKYEISEMMKFEFWVHIWTEYCRYDDAYANPETFQYNIDVGNGHSTPIPCFIMLISMFMPIFSPQVTGIIGALLFYQKWYGTLLYLFTYHNCNKGKHLTPMEYYAAVLGTNGVWFTVPLWGLYVCIQMILTNSFDIIH